MPQAVLLDYGHTLAEFAVPTAELRAMALGGVAAHLGARGWPGAGRPGFVAGLDRSLQEHMEPIQAQGRDALFGLALVHALTARQPVPGMRLAPVDGPLLELAMRRATLGATRLAPGAAEAVRAIRDAGFRLAIVSDASFLAATLAWELAQLGLGGCFDAVVTSGEVGWFKPDRRMFGTALRMMGVPAERAWHVGDWWEGDVLGARAAGIRAVWRRREPGATVPDAAVPVIDALGELPALVVG